MTSNSGDLTRTTQLAAPTQLLIITPGPQQCADHTFEMRFTSTPCGARLARHLAAHRLGTWGIPYDTDPHDALVLIVAELSANAVRHGYVPGRDFHLRLYVPADSCPGVARVEVTDTRTERVPPRPAAVRDPGAGEGGRGLWLVSRLAVRWDWYPRTGGPGKTVWAECAVPGCDLSREEVR
ncbi:ATP-binding protein [Streptomyces sp. NPDC058000]|uniref:ATP-binding protein n=1 Tax=Streptomyces sp. NPDC058000 TaxID=3346299 RepID=UPI0036E77D91